MQGRGPRQPHELSLLCVHVHGDFYLAESSMVQCSTAHTPGHLLPVFLRGRRLLSNTQMTVPSTNCATWHVQDQKYQEFLFHSSKKLKKQDKNSPPSAVRNLYKSWKMNQTFTRKVGGI